MAHRKVYSTGGRYGTRMMTAGEPLTLSGPAARLALALGKVTDKRPRAARPQLDHDQNGHEGGSIKQTGDDITALRAAYQTKFDKRPFNGWDAATLREKLAAG